MVRTQVQLTERQYKALRSIAARQNISMAEVIRRALDKVVETESVPDREEIKRRAMEAVGTFHSGVSDLATRHDEYWAQDIANDHIR